MTSLTRSQTEFDCTVLPAQMQYGLRFNSEPITSRDELHSHEDYELFFSVSGGMIYEVAGKSFSLQPGDVLVIFPKEKHRPVSGSIAGSTRFCLQFSKELPGQLLAQEGSYSHLPQDFPRMLHLPEEVQQRVIVLFQQLQWEQAHQEWAHSLAERSLLTCLFLLLLRASFASHGSNAAQNAPSADKSQPVLRRVWQTAAFINANFSQNLSIPQLAEIVGTSRYRLSREFSEVMGCSPQQYLLYRRLSTARQMLSAGVPPTQTAIQCGFSDYSNFYRQFVKRYGISPKSYQESQL